MESGHMALWKKLLVVLSVLIMAGGVTGKVAGRRSGRHLHQSAVVNPAPVPAAGARDIAPDGATVAQTPTPVAAPTADGIDWDHWSPPIFRFGFSFFAGFCIAYALRTVIKVGLFVAGAVLSGSAMALTIIIPLRRFLQVARGADTAP